MNKSTLPTVKLAIVAIAMSMVALAGCAGTATASTTAATTTAATTSLPVTATLYGDQRVTATSNTAQTLVTTAPTVFDGTPVVVDFGVEYVNMIPDATQGSNGIGFYLFEDGTYIQRLTLFGNHNSGLNQFGPVFVHTILDGAETPTAGTHVFSVTVTKWQPTQDGYLRAADGQPIRLTVSKF